MRDSERMMKLLAANPKTLAKIDNILNGLDGSTGKSDEDCRLVTYTSAAKLLNLSRPTIYRLVQMGRLEVVPLDGVNRIRLQSIFDFANRTAR